MELKERFYSHRLKASCATNGYLLDFYWKLGRDIEAKQYTNTYGSGFYKNLSQDLKNKMPGVKGFSPTNLKYISYFYKLYAPLQANCPQLADNFIEDLYIADIQRVVAQSKNRPQTADDFKLLFLIPWDHHRRIIDKCKGNMDKALFFVRKTWENNWGRDVLLNWLDTDLYERDGKAIENELYLTGYKWEEHDSGLLFRKQIIQEYDGTEMPLATYRRYMPWELRLE